MRDVAVVSFAQHTARREDARNEVEILLPVVREALKPTGLTTQDMGFTCSGSSDYLAGQAFAFVSAVDAVGPWPPIAESHVEMDGAFALYEAWVRLQHGDIDTALVYAFGKSSPGDVGRVLSLQLEPYVLGPLWPDAGQPGRAAGPGAARLRQGDREGPGAGGRPQPQGRAEQPARAAVRVVRRGGAARPAALRRPAAHARLPADHATARP